MDGAETFFLHDVKRFRSYDPHVTGDVPGLYLDDLHFLDGDLVALARSVRCDKRRSI